MEPGMVFNKEKYKKSNTTKSQTNNNFNNNSLLGSANFGDNQSDMLDSVKQKLISDQSEVDENQSNSEFNSISLMSPYSEKKNFLDF